MKALLFVQVGDALPRSFPTTATADTYSQHSIGCPGYRAALAAVNAKNAADRWWLVECMDAEHGRGIISHVVKHGEDAVQPAVGRILASGGRAE